MQFHNNKLVAGATGRSNLHALLGCLLAGRLVTLRYYTSLSTYHIYAAPQTGSRTLCSDSIRGTAVHITCASRVSAITRPISALLLSSRPTGRDIYTTRFGPSCSEMFAVLSEVRYPHEEQHYPLQPVWCRVHSCTALLLCCTAAVYASTAAVEKRRSHNNQLNQTYHRSLNLTARRGRFWVNLIIRSIAWFRVAFSLSPTLQRQLHGRVCVYLVRRVCCVLVLDCSPSPVPRAVADIPGSHMRSPLHRERGKWHAAAHRALFHTPAVLSPSLPPL